MKLPEGSEVYFVSEVANLTSLRMQLHFERIFNTSHKYLASKSFSLYSKDVKSNNMYQCEKPVNDGWRMRSKRNEI